MRKFFEFYNWCVDKMVKKIFAVVGLALLFLLIIGASSAADIDINKDGTFSDVQNGINQAQSGDTIYLNNHTFTGSGSEISVAGGWLSNKDKITIDGSINPNKGGTGNEMSTLDAKSSSRVFNIGASSITLKNIIITNGKYSGRDANGAGVYSSGSNLVLENCVISNCEASSSSRGDVHSALYSENTVTLSRCTLVNNKATSTYNTVTNSYVVRTASFDGSMTDCIVRDNYVSSIGTMAIGITIVGSSSNKVSNTKFMNNYATSTNGNAFGAALQVLGTVSNCTFEYNQANSDVNNSHAGALCFRPGSTVYNCTFIGNIAYRGAATTFHASGELKDCIFINNTATGFGGAISTGYDGTTGQKVKISNSYFEGNAAPIGGAITTHGNDITVDNSTFISNKAADGGAVYVVDDGITVLNSNFGNNSAKNHAGAIYVKGNNVKIQNATFVNNSAHFAGAVRVEGNYVNVLNATFIGNKAISDGVSKSQAGALGISGNNVNIDSSYFVNNTVEGDAGAIGVKGSHIKVTNSQFYSNHADPFNNDLNTGLGGAIYTMGNNVTYDNAIFRYNTAVNGSALFVDGVASLKNIVFYRNQAYTYALPIIVQNPKNPYGVTVNVTVVIIGGNNIANAIHHVGQLNDISFDNVTYLFNVNGTIMNRTTGADELHPVDGVENSKNGTLIYRDERENTQSINPIVIYDEDGNIIYNETLISSIYGDVRFSLSGLAPGNYTIKAEHPEDLFYKAIKNETNFEVVGFVDLDVDITTDKNYYGLDEEVEWTISLTNHGPHTDNYCYVNGIKLEDIVGFTPSKGTFDVATGIWKVGKLAKNEVVSLKVKTKTTSLGTIALTVNAVNSTEDTNISNNVATKSIYIQELPKVVPTKDVNVTNPNYGDKVKYTIVVSNVGKITADVTLTDILDKGLIFTGASGNYEYDSTTRTVIWNIDGLAVGQNLTFYVYATVDAYGVLNNTVTVGDNTVIRNVTVPEITPDKTIDNDSPNFGDKVLYTVTVTNGEFEANNVIVKDVVGNGLTVTDISDNGQYDPITRTITWIVDLAKNEVKTFTVEATVSGYGNISNKVVVGNKTIFKNVDVPEITPKKDVNNTAPNFGENVAYTIVVSNDGISDAKQVVITDTLAKGLKFIGANYNGVYDKDTHTVTWTLDIDAGKTVELKVNVTVEDYGVLVNKVTVGDKTSSVYITIPEIIPDKTANVTDANFGDNVTYTVTVTNDGDVDASQVVIVDQLGNGLKYVSSSDGGVWDEKTNTVTWIVDLAAGETKTLNVVATVVGYGNVTNSLAVGNKTSKINVNVPEITPNKTADNKNPNFGDNVTYTIVVSNDGAADAKNVVVKDILAPGFKFIEANYGGVYDELTRTVTWIVDVNAKDHVDLTIKVTVEDYGVLTNNVTVGNKTSSVNITVPEIIPNKTADIENPNFGDNVTYTVTVTNDGNADAKEVVVRDVLGKDLKFVSATGTYTFDEATNTITWIVDVAAGKTETFTVVATVINYGNVTNSLVVGNKTFNKNVTVPEITPDKTVDNENPNFGDNLTYTVTVKNEGNGNATDVIIVDTLGKGLEYVSSTGNYDNKTNTITWKVNLASGETKTFTVVAKIVGYTDVTNKVTVGNKTAAVTVYIPEIIPAKDVNNTTPNFGDKVEYTVTVNNNANKDAKQVVIVDTLGKGLKFINASHNGKYDESTRTITWIIDLGAGESAVFSVNAAVEAYGNINNTVVVGNKSATKNITVPEITPIKKVENTVPNFGEEVTYFISVFNSAIVDAKQVVVVDHLDKGLKYVSSSHNGVYDEVAHTVTWVVDIAAGSSLDLTVTAVADEYGVLTNDVTVGDKSASAVVTVPEIIPGKSVDVENPNFNDEITYTVTVTNNGVGDAKQVVVRDVLGEGLKFVKATGEYTFDEATNTVTWIVDLAKGESQTFYVTAVAEAYGVLSNNVFVGDKIASAVVTVPEIIPGKSVDVENPNFGDNVTYTVTVTNNGIVDAKQVVVVDHLDKGLKYVSSSNNGVYDEASHTVTWVVDIAAGSSLDLTVTAVADEYGVLTNDVTVGDKRASVDVTVPEIIPTKDVNNTAPNFGDKVEYTITLNNNGVVDAKQVVVVDTLDEGLTFVSASDNGVWNPFKRTVTWTVDLAKGESKVFTVIATVSAYGNIPNTVSVGDKSSSVNIAVPEIIPGKTVDVENPNFGDTVTYTVVVTNNGVVDAKQVVVRDILDKGLKFVKATGEYTFDEDSRTVTWIVDLAKGESQTFYVTAVAEAYGVLTNDVTVGDNTASADVVVPEINPDKTANITNPNFGDKVDYTVTVTNDGIGDANNVVIVDRLGEGLTFVSASDNGVWDPVKRTVTWIVDLAKGESKVFSVIATVSGYGNVTNYLVVGNKTAGVNVTVPEIIPDKTANISNPNFGDNVTYTVTVTNDGIGDAKDVVVRDVLGEGLKFVSATGEYTWDEDSRTVTWIVDLAKGESRTFYVNATVSGYGNVTNSLIVGNKTISVNVTVPEIIPDKTVGIENPNFGDNVTYTVTVTNDGIGGANNVVVRDILGEGLTFVDATGNYTFDKDSRTVTWIVDLAKGESRTFYVNAIVSGYGNVTNYLVVGNKTAGVNVTVPEIIPDKTANISNPNFGDNVTYTVTVTNDGIGDAKDVVVRDVLGEGLKFVSATGNYTFDEATRTVTWIVDLAKGESKVFSVIATVSGYGNVTNSLVVGNKTTGVNVTVPEINPDKTVDNEIPNFGDNVTYNVTVTNDGIGDANNVVITDVLDKGLKFLNATGNFTYDEKTGTITWTVDLAKGETKTFNVNVTVLGYGVLPNTVAVGNKTAVRNITVPEIITVKEVNSSDIHIGDEITYTITVSNPGKINATNVVIMDILPEGLKFINASNGGVYDPVTGIITWILNITDNSTVDLTADVCVNKSGNITNTVNVGNKTSNCTIESGDIVDLEIHIVADKSEIYVGDNVVYTVTVINNGPSDAINTIANILIPNALSILSYNATKGTFDITSGNWSIGNLTNGEKVVLTFVAKALNEGNSTVYVNVTSETFEVIMENNYDNVTVKVLKKADPIGPDKPVHPDGSSSDNEGKGSVNLPNTGNPLVMLLLCILSVIFVGSRKRKL